MTEAEGTVAVPVELLKRFRDKYSLFTEDRNALETLIPKPKPRLVVVDLNGEYDRWYAVDLKEQPDLLELLDNVIDSWTYDGVVGAAKLKERIRTTLGAAE